MTKQTHRHLVAVPIALLMVLTFASVASFVPVRAELRESMQSVRVSAFEKDEELNLGSSITGILRAGSEISSDTTGTRISLKSGQVLLRSSGFSTFTLDGVLASAWHGSFVAVRDSDSIMLAALDAPLIVTTGTTSLVLAPSMQARFTKNTTYAISPIGSEWLSLQIHDLRSLRPRVQQNLPEEVMRRECLPEERMSDDTSRVLSALLLSGRITSDVYDCVLRLSKRIDNTDTLRRLSLLALATEATRTEEEVSLQILEEYKNDLVLRNSVSEVLPVLAVVKGRAIQPALLNFYSTVVIEKGLVHAAEAIVSLEKAVSVPQILKNRGLPLQADAWQSAIVYTMNVLKSAVTFDQRIVLKKLLQQVSQLSSERIVEAVSRQVAKPTTDWTDDELLLLARNALISEGALFASSTVLLPDADTQTVRAEGIYAYEDSRNVLYSFTYDPALKVLTQIIREGKNLPNDVPVHTFFRQ